MEDIVQHIRDSFPLWTVPESLGLHELDMRYEFPETHVLPFEKGGAATWTDNERRKTTSFIDCKTRAELAAAVSRLVLLSAPVLTVEAIYAGLWGQESLPPLRPERHC